jgi:hypothetical protein
MGLDQSQGGSTFVGAQRLDTRHRMGKATAAEFPASNERERLHGHVGAVRPLGAGCLTLVS